jgi:thymidylate synthase (FAD)
MTHPLQWQKFFPLSDKNAFICLVDHMGDDSSIVQAARVSYGKDEQEAKADANCHSCKGTGKGDCPGSVCDCKWIKFNPKDRQLIRYLMNHSHTTPFEMVEIKFMVQVPMDCWRQWIRHRTANVNEYSTRYTEALDFFQVTQPTEWRLQSSDNKQGSSGYLEDNWKGEKGGIPVNELPRTKRGHCALDGAATYLSTMEKEFHEQAKQVYQTRLRLGVAKEQARKDLPLSTYTRAYWKCDLHNIFNFLRLRMDSHAQLEIRSFANCMAEIVKQLCPVAYEAFEDYVLHAKKFSRMEMEVLRKIYNDHKKVTEYSEDYAIFNDKPDSMTDREWKDFLAKLS